MDEPQTAWERVRLGHLIFGILFILLGISGVAGADLNAAWIGAALLAAGGLAGLLGSIRSVVGPSGH